MKIDTHTPSLAARRIIEELDIQHPSEIKVNLIAENRGATVVESHLTSSEGRMVRRGRKGKITVPATESNVGRKRFSIGHELGHFEMHSYLANLIVCSKYDMSDWNSHKKRETEANIFSAELLMPEFLFTPRIIKKTPNMVLIQKLASEFRTSLTATAYRYIQLTKEPCALIYSVDGKVDWFIKNTKDFNFFLKKKGSPVDEESFAFDAFNGKGDSLYGSLVPATAWVDSTHPMFARMELKESTIYLEYYNATLTLLWEP